MLTFENILLAVCITSSLLTMAMMIVAICSGKEDDEVSKAEKQLTKIAFWIMIGSFALILTLKRFT